MCLLIRTKVYGMDNIDSLLLSGKDIEVGEVVVINHTLDHIFNVMKIEKYHSLISLPVITPTDFDLGDILDDEAIKGMSMYKMACIFEDVREMFIDFLNSFTYHKWEFNEVFNEFVAHVSDTERVRLNEKKIGEIFDVAKKIYCIPKREAKVQHKDTEIDNILKEFEEFDRKTKHKSKSNGITLNSIVLAVSTRHNT